MTEQTQPTHLYQAIGFVEGIVDITMTPYTLTVGETVFPAFITKRAQSKHLPGQTQCFKVYPGLRQGRPTFKVVAVANTPPQPFVLKGCWELYQDVPFLAIYRNPTSQLNDRQLRSLLAVQWQDAPPPDGKFWELEAALEGDQLVITKAEGPFDPPPKVTQLKHTAKASAAKGTPQSKVQPAATQQPQVTATPLTIEEIREMATPAKVQLTCKLSQVPAHRELPDKKIEFFLSDEGDRIFTVRVKPKIFKKLTDHGYDQWVAAITGELGSATETGFELVNSSVQVFEKKAKADATAEQEKAPHGTQTPLEKTVATAKPQPPEAEAPAKAGRGKHLLDGIRLK